jgi:integrase
MDTHRSHSCSDDVDVPVSPELMAAIDAMPKKHLTFIVSATGKSRSKFGIAADFVKWARAAGLPDHCRMHGLKKAGMARHANAGDSTHKLMALSGHKTLSMVQLYTRAFDKKKLLKGTKRDANVTNSAAPTYKLPSNLLK